MIYKNIIEMEWIDYVYDLTEFSIIGWVSEIEATLDDCLANKSNKMDIESINEYYIYLKQLLDEYDEYSDREKEIIDDNYKHIIKAFQQFEQLEYIHKYNRPEPGITWEMYELNQLNEEYKEKFKNIEKKYFV